MNRIAASLLVLGCGVSVSFSKTHKAWTLASEVFAAVKPAESDRSPKARVAAANALIAMLSADEKKQLLLPFNYLTRHTRLFLDSINSVINTQPEVI